MRKTIFLYLLFCFWFQTTQSQHIQKGLSQAGLIITENKDLAKNKVRSVLEKKSFSSSASAAEGESYFFDKNGNVTEQRRFTDTGEGPFHFIWKFTYNNENNLLKATQIATKDLTTIYSEEYQYDKARGLTIITGRSNAEYGAFRRIEQYYNKQGQHIKTAWYEPDSLLSFTHFNNFDGKGNKIATTVWGPWKIEMFEIRNGIEIDPETQAEEIRTGIKFDPDKKVEEENEESKEDFRQDYLAEVYSEEEEEEPAEPLYIAKKVKQDPDSSTVFYEYNAKGKVTEYRSGSGDSFYKVTYKYNKKDQLVETNQMDEKGRVYHKEIFLYNKAGLLIAMDEYYDGDKPVIFHKYTYTFY